MTARTESTTQAATTSETDTALLAPPAGSMHVRFSALDGVRLDGTLLAGGPVAVVLVHMGNSNDSQADWFGLAKRLNDAGYTVLAYNRRGVCLGGAAGCSGRPDDYVTSWNDVVGAARLLERRGARGVVIVGASIGAMSSLYAVASGKVKPIGLVEIAGVNNASGYSFVRADFARVRCPTLFVSAENDPYGGAEAAQQWFRWANAPKRIELLPGREHGTDMLLPEQPTARRLTRTIVDFVDDAADRR
jgi:pimeloyl-ACP methyl ester carboxylesterase